jgi:cellulose synthase/poly-beta-1,6-N-acetylglucosamine synthase-like glycosyltransferase
MADLALMVSLYAIAVFSHYLQTSLKAAPRLGVVSSTPHELPTIAVIIPAYNEAINLYDCVQAVLASELPNPEKLEIWIADDESTDRTGAIAQELMALDQRVRLVSVPSRPSDQVEVWRGKNWACANAVDQTWGEYLLFIDADVRLEPGAIAAAIADAETHQADLLSCVPEIVCGCFAEWLVQPIMFSLLAVGFDFPSVNAPECQDDAFAAGPFMLFRRQAYVTIGGHRAVAWNLLEDVALAHLIKQKGLKLRYILGSELIKVRMYQSFSALWEGWTKNYHLGSERDVWLTLYSALVLFLVFTLPWLGFVGSSGCLLANLFSRNREILPFMSGWLTLTLAVAAIAFQYRLRQSIAQQFQQPLRYWWLNGIGGLIAAAIAITSLIKIETGWGWTWRGRSLAVNRNA